MLFSCCFFTHGGERMHLCQPSLDPDRRQKEVGSRPQGGVPVRQRPSPHAQRLLACSRRYCTADYMPHAHGTHTTAATSTSTSRSSSSIPQPTDASMIRICNAA